MLRDQLGLLNLTQISEDRRASSTEQAGLQEADSFFFDFALGERSIQASTQACLVPEHRPRPFS